MRNLKYYTKKKRKKRKARRKALRESGSHLKELYRVYLENINPITVPLALISQIQRSGGSLLSQLFDGHPEIHAHPHELKIGHPKKHIWPNIDLNANPKKWFEILFEANVLEHFAKGYKKGQKSEKTLPFIFLPSLQLKIFLKYIDSVEAITQRDVFDAYMTSYFGAWLNNQNICGEKKFIVAFTARLAMIKDSVEKFSEIYPDGRLISIIRDPKNWFPSAFRHDDKKRKYVDIKEALNQWQENAQAILRNKEKYGSRICIIRFEDLISDTNSVMRHLADFLTIEFDDILLKPTFNRFPIEANTSFESESPGIMISTLSRYKTLTQEELNIIDEITEDVYQQVLRHTVKFE
jgi:hypothetical protein